MNHLLVLSLFWIPSPVTESKLSHRYEGDKLIVWMTVTVDEAPHILMTSTDNTDALSPGLRYVIIQNADVVAVATKKVTVEWKFHKDVHVPNRVNGQVIKLNATELTQLGGKAAELVKEAK